jgi:hypothetical protein
MLHGQIVKLSERVEENLTPSPGHKKEHQP